MWNLFVSNKIFNCEQALGFVILVVVNPFLLLPISFIKVALLIYGWPYWLSSICFNAHKKPSADPLFSKDIPFFFNINIHPIG